MKLLSKLTLGTLLVAMGGYASAADLMVRGTIVPPSCKLELRGGNIVDYGKIYAGSLEQHRYNNLGVRSLPFSISCEGGTRVGMKTVDNRAASRVPGILSAANGSGYRDIHNYGLGTTEGGQRIGGYALTIKNHSANIPVHSIFSSTNGMSWSQGPGILGHGDSIVSWSNSFTSQPTAVEWVSGTLEVQAVINKTSQLDVTQDVSLDGLATLELRYL